VNGQQKAQRLAQQENAHNNKNETVAVAGTAAASFEIKSANLPLVALLLKSADLHALERDFAARFGDIPDFFDGDAMVIDLSRLEPLDAAVDFGALVALLKRYRLIPVGVREGHRSHIEAAAAAGLLSAVDARIQPPAPKTAPAKAEPPASASSLAPPPPTLVIDRPLRSGQQVYARGRDLVVLAMVNAGAEVIADGNVHVYAPLRGRAMAGARGDAEARIFSFALEPELISIAGVYRTGEEPLPETVRGKPAQVRLVTGPDGERLVFEPLNG
jgi:septum site-determining protein MinC